MSTTTAIAPPEGIVLACDDEAHALLAADQYGGAIDRDEAGTWLVYLGPASASRYWASLGFAVTTEEAGR